MQAHVGRATARVTQTVRAPARLPSPAFRVKGAKVRLKVLAKASRRVKAAVARRGRLNRLRLDKLKSAVAAMTRQHRQPQPQPQPVVRTMSSHM
jgi:hypothetical protein